MNRRALLLGSLALTALYPGTAFAETRWQHYNRDPAYASRDAAIADAERVFIRAGWPRDIAREMAAKMRSESGQVIELVNGDRLDFMRTGSSGLWRDVLVDFRPYTMTIRAPAELWVIERNGERFEAILPRVCNNLAGRRTSRPRPCAFVVFEARPGDAYAIVHILGPAQSEEHCVISYAGASQNRNFGGQTFHRLSETVTDACPTDWIPERFGLPGLMRGSFGVTPGFWAVKVPVELADNPGNRVVICLVREDGTSTFSLGVPSREYHVAESGHKVATIWYSENEVPEVYRRHETILWWRWARMRSVCAAAPAQ